MVETGTRLRNSGAETSPDILFNPAIQGLKAQLAAAETKLTEMSAIVGKNHPARIQLEAQIGEVKQQIIAESRRVAGGTSTINRTSSQKLAELKGQVEEQKKKLMALRADRDQVAFVIRDVETAHRASAVRSAAS